MKRQNTRTDIWLPTASEVKRMREERGWTQAELARKANVSQSLVAKFESGTMDPGYSKVKRVIETLIDLPEEDRIKARDIANCPVVSVSPEDEVALAVGLMSEGNYSQLPVIEGKIAVGSISESCIVRHFGSEAETMDIHIKVRRIMDPPFTVVDGSFSVALIRGMVLRNQAVLVSEKGEIQGIITKADFFKMLGL